MALLGYFLFCLLGAGVALLSFGLGWHMHGATGLPKEKEGSNPIEPLAGLSPRLQKQFDNLLVYDGTERGQQEIATE